MLRMLKRKQGSYLHNVELTSCSETTHDGSVLLTIGRKGYQLEKLAAHTVPMRRQSCNNAQCKCLEERTQDHEQAKQSPYETTQKAMQTNVAVSSSQKPQRCGRNLTQLLN